MAEAPSRASAISKPTLAAIRASRVGQMASVLFSRPSNSLEPEFRIQLGNV
jgi:hypothetical protein